jgi:hypothetical protein
MIYDVFILALIGYDSSTLIVVHVMN